jgi:hypothetical protein
MVENFFWCLYLWFLIQRIRSVKRPAYVICHDMIVWRLPRRHVVRNVCLWTWGWNWRSEELVGYATCTEKVNRKASLFSGSHFPVVDHAQLPLYVVLINRDALLSYQPPKCGLYFVLFYLSPTNHIQISRWQIKKTYSSMMKKIKHEYNDEAGLNNSCLLLIEIINWKEERGYVSGG